MENPLRLAMDSWCLRKLIHWTRENTMIDIIADECFKQIDIQK